MGAIVLCSIPYTGTGFTCELFQRAGYDVIGLHQSPQKPKTLLQGHMLKHTQIVPAMDLAESLPLVIPMRHPYRCEESWRRKGLDIGEMITAYRTLATHFLVFDPYFLPVDSPSREDFLVRLKMLEPGLSTNWEPANVKSNTSGIPFEDLTPSPEVVQLVKDHKRLLSRFYDL